MIESTKKRVSRVLRAREDSDAFARFFVCVAVLTMVAVAFGLRQRGFAATHTEQVLDCHYAGDGAHTHDTTCYDADGNLVCPLQERAYHVHDDSCYVEARVLTCGLEESAEHAHTASCYTVERELTCGMEEVTEQHTHGPGCFKTITVADGADAAAGSELANGDANQAATDTAASETAEAETPSPAQTFAHNFEDADGKLVLGVDVDAPEGALPAGTTMRAAWIDAASLTSKEQKAIEKAVGKKTDGKIMSQMAVDIAFVDADGKEVEPAKKVTVTFTSGSIDTADMPVVAHVNDLTKDQLKAQKKALEAGKTADEAEPARKAQVVEQLDEATLAQRKMELSADQLAFDATNFSMFVLNVTSEAHTLVSEGEDVRVVVEAPAAAGVPAEATLAVTELADDTYAAQLQEVLGAEGIAQSRYFDVHIMNGAQEVVPATPVKLSFELADAPEDAAGVAVTYLGEQAKLVAAGEDLIATSFEAADMGVYAVAYTADSVAEVDVETGATDSVAFEGEAGGIKVVAEAAADAFPAGTTMEVKPVKAADVRDAVEQAVEGTVARVSAVDITFRDAEGAEVQPASPVKVSMSGVDVPSQGEPVVVHLDAKGQGSLVEQAGSDNAEVAFEAESFSVYAVAVIWNEEGELVVETDRYAVTVGYTKEAEIPFGTELEVREISPESDRYWALWSQTIDKLNEGVTWENHDLPDPRKGLSDAAFFDITLRNGSNKIEPKVPLKVSIRYKEGGVVVPKGEDPLVVHFAEEGIELIDGVEVESGKVTDKHLPRSMREGSLAEGFTYEQGSFSIVGTGSTSEYIEINEHNISGPALKLAPLNSGESTIKASKTLTDTDGDGVYELALNVEGASQSSGSTVVDKSNVVIVVDVSGSMDETISFIEYTYSPDTYNENTNYYWNNNGYAQECFYWPGGNRTWTTLEWRGFSLVEVEHTQYYDAGWYYGNNWNVHTGAVYTRRTRLDATKEALGELVDALLANNKPAGTTASDGTKLDDIIEISLLSFSSVTRDYSGPTSINDAVILREMSTSGSDLHADIDGLSAGGGTDWEAALRQAKTAADAYNNQTGETTSIIFLTDGMPTFYLNNADNRPGGQGGTGGETYRDGWGNEHNDVNNVRDSWNYAKDDARALVTAGYKLYNIFTYGSSANFDGNRKPSDFLKALTNYAYGTANTGSDYTDTATTQYTQDYFFDATDTTALTEAFRKIIKKITNEVGYGGVTVDDGVTLGVTNTSVTVDGSVNPHNFRYMVSRDDQTVYSVRFNTDDNNVITSATFTIPGHEPQTVTEAETVVTKIDPNDQTTWITSTVYSVTIDDKTYAMSPAVMDASNGRIDWDLAGMGILENGLTYTLAFDVWANQDAYDTVADLNNGLITESDVSQEILKYLVKDETTGKYSIRTNYEQYVDYYTVDTTDDGSGEGPKTTYTHHPKKDLGPVDPVPLTSTTMKLRKLWEDSLDQTQLDNWLEADHQKVRLHVWKADTLEQLQSDINTYGNAVGDSYAQADTHDYLDKTLGWNDDANAYDELKTLADGRRYWEKDLEVAPGVMVTKSTAEEMGVDLTKHAQVTYGTKTYVVLETGHYYAVTEEDIERHFELNTIVYHPMLVDGELSNVTFNADGTVEKVTPLSSIDATNALRGGINITKAVVDENNQAITYDGTFDTLVTLTVPMKGGKPDFASVEDYTNQDGSIYKHSVAWYRYYDSSNNVVSQDKLIDAGILARGEDGQVTGDNFAYGTWFYLDFDDTTGTVTKTVKIHPAYTVRFANMAAGTGYSLEETGTNGMTCKSVEYTKKPGGGDEVPDTAATHTVTANAENNIKVTNQTTSAGIALFKVGDGDERNPLSGVEFKLYSDVACTKRVTRDASGNKIGGDAGVLVTGADGKVSIGNMVSGTYYLKEIKTASGYIMLATPVVINIGKDGMVTATQELSGEENIASKDDDTYVVKVNNPSGVELPAAGGPGTALLYALGVVLMAGGALVLYQRVAARA